MPPSLRLLQILDNLEKLGINKGDIKKARDAGQRSSPTSVRSASRALEPPPPTSRRCPAATALDLQASTHASPCS